MLVADHTAEILTYQTTKVNIISQKAKVKKQKPIVGGIWFTHVNKKTYLPPLHPEDVHSSTSPPPSWDHYLEGITRGLRKWIT